MQRYVVDADYRITVWDLNAVEDGNVYLLYEGKRNNRGQHSCGTFCVWFKCLTLQYSVKHKTVITVNAMLQRVMSKQRVEHWRLIGCIKKVIVITRK